MSTRFQPTPVGRTVTIQEEPFLPLGMDDQAWESYKATGDTDKRTTIAKQDAFLVTFAGIGTIRGSAPVANVHRGHVHRWISEDIHHFRSRFEAAILAFREGLQDIGMERIRAQKPNDNPLLLVAYLNAHWPEKFRRDTVVIGSDAVKELLIKLTEGMARDMAKEKQVIEGEGHVLTPQEQVKQLTKPQKQ